MAKFPLYLTCGFAILIVGMAIWSIPRIAAKEKVCNEKDGVLIKGANGYSMCIKKDVVIK